MIRLKIKLKKKHKPSPKCKMDYKSYGDYKVYINGTVWSNKTSKFLKQQPDIDGYLRISPWINGKRTSTSIHRLMGVLFLPNIKNLPTIDHKDRNRLNNSLFNLKWETLGNQQLNRNIQSNNTSGYKGVSYYKRTKKWVGKMTVNKKISYKSFDTKEEAILYRLELEADYEISLIRNADITSIINRI